MTGTIVRVTIGRRGTERPRVFWRTPVVPWSFVGTGAVLSWALSPLGPPQWHNTPSLRWLHVVFPWPVIAGLFAVYTLLNLWSRTREIAAWLGLTLYLIGFVALLVTTDTDRPANPLAIAAVFLACVLHFAAARLGAFHGARQ